MNIFDLVVEPNREEHIARHHVTLHKVEQVVDANSVVTRSRQDRYRLIGQTEAGRYFCVIIAPRGYGIFGLVTARDADLAERRLFQRQRRS